MDLETTVANETEQVQPDVSTEQSEAQDANPLIPQAEPEILDWTQDKRAKTMWKNDPNQLYGSYKSMEKMYSPLKAQTEQLQGIFKEHGIEAEQLGDVLKEYKTYSDPNSPQNQMWNYLQTHVQAEHQGEIIEFFNNLDRKLDQKKYGENLPPEVIEKLKLAEQTSQRLNAIEKAEQEKAQYQQTIKTIESKLTSVESMAKEYDVTWDEATKNGFLRHCSDNNIAPELMEKEFAFLAMKAIKQSAAVQGQRAVVKNIETNKKAGITTKTVAGASKSAPDNDFRSVIRNQLFGNK